MLEKITDFFAKLIMLLILINLLIIMYRLVKERNEDEYIQTHDVPQQYVYYCPPSNWSKGLITYYHSKFHGKITKYNEVYDKDGFTCASNTFPYKSVVFFFNPKNSKLCYGIVNDTGSFRTVDFDVSERIAKELDIIQDGKAEVFYLVLGTIDEIAGNCFKNTN